MKNHVVKIIPILLILVIGVFSYLYFSHRSSQAELGTKKYAQEVYRSHEWEFPTVLAPDTPPNLVYLLLEQVNSVEGGKKTAYLLRNFDDGKWYLYAKVKSEFSSDLAAYITDTSQAKLSQADIDGRKTNVVAIPIKLKDRTRITDFFLLTSD